MMITNDYCSVCNNRKLVEVKKLDGTILVFGLHDFIETTSSSDEIRAVCSGCGLIYKIESVETTLKLPMIMY